jgi:glycosyltransferase involved in cell wall biosynthesis
MEATRKIRILETIRQGQVGGGETHVFDLVKSIDKAKFEVEVLSFTEGPMVDKLNALGIKTHIISTKKPFDFTIWKGVKKLIQLGKFDIVHAHGTRAASNVFYAAKKLRIPYIYTVHGWSFHDGQNKVVRKLRELSEGFLTKKADLTIAVSKSNQQDGKMRFNLKKSKVIFNGIDGEKFNSNKQTYTDIRAEFGIDAGKTLVGYLVRMTYQKDPITMIKAIEAVVSKTQNVHFLLVGNGELLEETKTLAQDLKLMKHITFSDFRSDIPDILKAIDIYCLPSLWEGMPIGLLEAMAMGKACIATGVDGTKELITSNENGILIPKKDENSLASAILELHHNKSKRIQLSENAQQYVQRNFSLEEMVQKIEKTYFGFTTVNSDYSF